MPTRIKRKSRKYKIKSSKRRKDISKRDDNILSNTMSSSQSNISIPWTSLEYKGKLNKLKTNLFVLIRRPHLVSVFPSYASKKLYESDAQNLYYHINKYINSDTKSWDNKKELYNYLISIRFNRFLYMFDNIDSITGNLKHKNEIKQIFNAVFNKKFGNINRQINSDGDTLLIFTTQKNYYYIADMLLRRPDLNVNQRNYNNDTALTIVSWQGKTDMVRLLLRRPDIDKNITNYNGDNALSLAKYKKHYDIVNMLS